MWSFPRRTKRTFVSLLSYTRNVKSVPTPQWKIGSCWVLLRRFTGCEAGTPVFHRAGNERLVDAAFAAHPADPKEPGEYVDVVRNFNVPFSMAIQDVDFAIPKQQIAIIETELRLKLNY
ncbi:hypothetical protein EYZ11_009706 [Aspergillus tanneri]|uniref:Uncharacterized protein n=1 Tax=Aspergillus tanneri TaxID=1220188 RepID=A0A4S3J9D6_9EURO|nr:hypothetical protein EYZ11_009706 [Aspergillus tanneri]